MLKLTYAQLRTIERLTSGANQAEQLTLRASMDGAVILSYPGSPPFYLAPDGIVTMSVQDLLDYLYGTGS